MKNLISIIGLDNLKEKIEDFMILTERKLGLSCYGFPFGYYPGMIPHRMTLSELEKYAEIVGLKINRNELKNWFNDEQKSLNWNMKHKIVRII